MKIVVGKPSLGSAAASFLAKEAKLLIEGKWVPANSGKAFPVEDPATEEIIAHVPAGEKADIDAAVAAARQAFETGPWSSISPSERSHLVWRLGDLLEQHADEFAQLEALDSGKPVTNARRDDVEDSINIFRYMAGWATRPNGETIQVSSPGNWHAYTLREPVGVVGQIIPWNFPLTMAAKKLAPALADRLHDRPQACRADATVGVALWRVDPRIGHPGRCGQYRHRLWRNSWCRAR